MANKYAKVDVETSQIFEEVLGENHDEMTAIGVTFDILFGYAPVNDEGERTGNALKIHGFPTNSISSIVNLKNRVKGNADAEIVLDGDIWPDLTIEQKKAVLDRAVEQFEISRNIDGEVITDTHGRPKLKMRQADWCISVFTDIVKRHGVNAPESAQLAALVKNIQLAFDFMKQIEAPKKKSKE
jgi:hypothetical protein